ncbi:MAG: hypothetical protein H6Q52_3166 [Deltaproteobacteria bacterium]|nr:hypothetical protein [Deltaproteobacteria bacterium]
MKMARGMLRVTRCSDVPEDLTWLHPFAHGYVDGDPFQVASVVTVSIIPGNAQPYSAFHGRVPGFSPEVRRLDVFDSTQDGRNEGGTFSCEYIYTRITMPSLFE